MGIDILDFAPELLDHYFERTDERPRRRDILTYSAPITTFSIDNSDNIIY